MTIAKHTSHEGFVNSGIAAEFSAGIGIDGDHPDEIFLFKQVGKVSGLKALVDNAEVDKAKIFDTRAPSPTPVAQPTVLPASSTAILSVLTRRTSLSSCTTTS
ncbi:hypothetical protein M422DRAFT_248970 [Sphaerobolus stellatus SS14]|nr:hypothetical protein M422DRAFT_248968 [Sphaerobolus stellatus SS14]KIJ47542.1 hypothetical protein M422DRAFT_248970 [Sphaerobolus stellatus SS14]